VQDALLSLSGGQLAIAFGPINSGLPKNIVEQIIAAEKIPLQQMETRKAKIGNKKKLLSDLTQKVEAIRGNIFANKSSRSFRELKINVSDTGTIGASVDKNLANPGNYQVEVVQLAQKSSAISNGVEDKDETYLGVGYLQYELPNGETKEVYIDSENSSLSGIAKLINKDSSNGMNATVVNSGDGSDTPWKLLITLSETGDDKKAKFPDLYLVDGMEDIWFEGHRDAQDAKIKLDGFEIELPKNETTDLIPGVSLDFKKAKPGEEIAIEVAEDNGKIAGKIDDLVKNVNEVLKFIKEQNTLDETVDTSQTLGGDLTLQTLESRIRGAIFKNIKTDFGNKRIGDLGLTFQRSGLLKLDSEKFESALKKNYEVVAQIIAGKYTKEDGKLKGFMDNMEDVINAALSSNGGILKSRDRGLKSQIDQIDRRIESKQRQIDRKEEMLKQKFARLEETITRIKGQGAGLGGVPAGPAL
jgi:flagellar hook-associated protein 2